MNNLIALRIIRTIVNAILGEPQKTSKDSLYQAALDIRKILIKNNINEN